MAKHPVELRRGEWGFRGSGGDVLPFFKALAFHQTKEWFEENRATYESAVKGPMGDLVEDVALACLAKAKIPIKRRPQGVAVPHPPRRALFEEQGPLQDQLRPRHDPHGVEVRSRGPRFPPVAGGNGFSPPGSIGSNPPQLGKLREAAARAPKPYKAMLARLGKAELALSEEDALKRAPRGFDTVDDAAIVAAARQRHFITLRPVPETAIREPALADALCAFARDALPLLEWGWAVLADFALKGVEHVRVSGPSPRGLPRVPPSR